MTTPLTGIDPTGQGLRLFADVVSLDEILWLLYTLFQILLWEWFE